MGIFEQHPWILIPIIIVTMETWSALKRLVSRRRIDRRELGD